ncbi:helicase C-terminal domain-containing protein [Vibrio sp. PNB22_3_1]
MAYKVALDEAELDDFHHIALERGLTASAAANDLIREALDRNLVPKLKAISTTNGMPTFQLRSSLIGRAKRHLKQNRYSFDKQTSQMLTGLIRAAMYDDNDVSQGDDEISAYTTQFFSRAGIAPRDMQMELVERFIKQQSNGQVSLHEASTGIGKTAAKLCAASYLIEKGNMSTVLIAVPTNKLIDQTVRQAEQFGLTVQKLRAKADFISDTALAIAIDDHPEHAASLHFVRDEVVRVGCHEIAGLSEEARDRIAKLPYSISCDQNTPDGDAGAEEYEQSCANFDPQGIVIATHVMLAHELFRLIYGRSNSIAQYGERYGVKLNYALHTKMQRKKANVGATAPKYDEWLCDELEGSAKEKHFDISSVLLPFTLSHHEKLALFIDEAHLYPSQVELALSSSVSIDLLIKRLSTPIALSGCRGFSDAAARLVQLHKVDLNSSSEIKEVLSSALGDLKLVSSASVVGLDAKSRLRLNRIKSAVDNLIAFASSPFDCHLNRSHRRKKLSLHSLVSLLPQLVLLQATHRFCNSIAYVSGTLNDHSGDYRLTCSGLRLNTPGAAKRLVRNESLIAPWLYKGVKFKVDDGFESNEDYERKADRIYDEWQEIKGGTLVLCNSYFEIEAIAARLAQLSSCLRVITDQSGVKLNNAREFLTSYRNGDRPIYLATGAAWTGLDMTDSDVPANEDYLIQLLVITKVPYSYMPAERTDFNTYTFTQRSSAALTKLKQGLGRLVRREGRQDMRILFLDAKYRSPHRVIFKRYIEGMYRSSGSV